MKKFLIILFFLTFISCEKDLDLRIPVSDPVIMVEGWIEQDRTAKILLTQSIPFFSNVDSASLNSIPVTKAKVTVTSSNETEILTLRPNSQYFPPYVYYSIDLKGKINEQYSIKIEYDQKIITAQTTIPSPVQLDSVWFQYEEENDTLGKVWIQLTDNPDEVNYYRVFTQRRGKDLRFVPGYISSFSDKAFNGGTIQLGILKGTGSLVELGENRYFEKGDTITVRFCTVDKEHFDFWDSVQGEIITSANPFAAGNARIKSNVNEGFGIWGGYGSSYYTVIAN